MKSKLITILILTLAAFSPVFAQKAALSESISLEQAQKIALQNNPGLKAKLLNTKISEKQVEQARWQKIPDVYADYNLQRNLIIPYTPVPAKAFDPNAPEGELLPLKFSTNWTSNAGLNAKVDLFNPQQHGQIKEARQQQKISETDFKISKNNLRYNVGKDYCACIIAAEQLKLAVEDTISKAKVLQMAEEQYSAGRIKITDLNQVQADKNTSISNYFQAKKILASAKAQLVTDMGDDLSVNYSFSFSDSIQSLLAEYKNQMPGDSGSLSLQKWNLQKELNEIQLQNTRAGFLPTVSLNAFYGANYFDNNFNYLKTRNWFGNSFVNLSIKVPITEGLDRVKRMDQLRLQIQANEANYQAQQNQNQLAKTQALQDISYNEHALLRRKENMMLARQNLQTATEQFSSGRLLAADLAKSDFLYQQSKTNYLQAAYDFIIVKMNLENAMWN